MGKYLLCSFLERCCSQPPEVKAGATNLNVYFTNLPGLHAVILLSN